jgi:hypothetical protein
VAQAQAAITEEMGKLGAGVLGFLPGHFRVNQQKRYGFVIRFTWGNGQGVIRVAGLPIKNQETQRKIEKIRVQALLNVRDWLKTMVTTRVFTPDFAPFLPYMLMDGEKTVLDVIREGGSLMLPPGPEIS